MTLFIGTEVTVNSVEALQSLAKALHTGSDSDTAPMILASELPVVTAGKTSHLAHEYNTVQNKIENEYSSIGTIKRTCTYMKTIHMQVWECTDGSSFTCKAGEGPWEELFCMP
ncbi:hypothetical protein [Parvibaculum sp.]|uniref:hypothetical protein n=1 Tax=Parvibaculum sp. TaxID=2024848 RepID=UPI00320E3E51